MRREINCIKDIMWYKSFFAFSDSSWTSTRLHGIFKISVGNDWCDWTSRYCSYINTVQAKKIVLLFPEMNHVKIFESLNPRPPPPCIVECISIYIFCFKKNPNTRSNKKQKKLKMKREKQKKPQKIRRKKSVLWTASVLSTYVIEPWIFPYCSHEFNLNYAQGEKSQYVIL